MRKQRQNDGDRDTMVETQWQRKRQRQRQRQSQRRKHNGRDTMAEEKEEEKEDEEEETERETETKTETTASGILRCCLTPETMFLSVYPSLSPSQTLPHKRNAPTVHQKVEAKNRPNRDTDHAPSPSSSERKTRRAGRRSTTSPGQQCCTSHNNTPALHKNCIQPGRLIETTAVRTWCQTSSAQTCSRAGFRCAANRQTGR